MEMPYLRQRLVRVKLPKSFLAVNLSDAFTFQEKERQNSEGDVLEMKAVGHSTEGDAVNSDSAAVPKSAISSLPLTSPEAEPVGEPVSEPAEPETSPDAGEARPGRIWRERASPTRPPCRKQKKN